MGIGVLRPPKFQKVYKFHYGNTFRSAPPPQLPFTPNKTVASFFSTFVCVKCAYRRCSFKYFPGYIPDPCTGGGSPSMDPPLAALHAFRSHRHGLPALQSLPVFYATPSLKPATSSGSGWDRLSSNFLLIFKLTFKRCNFPLCRFDTQYLMRIQISSSAALHSMFIPICFCFE